MRDASHDRPGGNLEMTFPAVSMDAGGVGKTRGGGGGGRVYGNEKKKKALWQNLHKDMLRKTIATNIRIILNAWNISYTMIFKSLRNCRQLLKK